MMNYDVLFLPLFFATAWMRADRTLEGTLSYRLPLSLRWRFPCIRWYWLCDLLLSAVALATVYSPLAGISGKLFQPSGASPVPGFEAANGVSHLSYPVAAVTLGFLWPQIASFKITLGASRQLLSLGDVRDYLLGGPVTNSINSRLQAEVSSYVGRIVDTMEDAGEAGPQILQALGLARKLATPEERQQLRETLMTRARADFESLHLLVSQVKMVPLMDRRRPLMKIPEMTAQEEEKLYQSGIETVGDLAWKTRCGLAGFPAERLDLLRRNAHRVLGQRFRVGMSIVAITVVVVGLGIGSRRLYIPDNHPQKAGEPVEIGSAHARAESPLMEGRGR